MVDVEVNGSVPGGEPEVSVIVRDSDGCSNFGFLYFKLPETFFKKPFISLNGGYYRRLVTLLWFVVQVEKQDAMFLSSPFRVGQ